MSGKSREKARAARRAVAEEIDCESCGSCCRQLSPVLRPKDIERGCDWRAGESGAAIKRSDP